MDIKNKDTYGYKSDVGFISNTFQITHHIDLFSRTNEAAIHDQTDRLEAIISAQTEQQKVDADLNRKNRETVFDKLINSIKGIFHSNKTGVTENFYDMVQRESDETQEQMKNNSQTIDNRLANVVKELESIQNSISGDTTQSISNTRNITNAINNIKLITN